MASADYLLITGLFVTAFLALSLTLLRALASSMAIKALVFALPVG